MGKKARPMKPVEMALMGSVFVVLGGWIILGSYGLVPFGQLLVKPWIAACMGGAFLLFGVFIWYLAIRSGHPPRRDPPRPKPTDVIKPNERIGAIAGKLFWATIFGLMLALMWALFEADGGYTEVHGPEWLLYLLLGAFSAVVVAWVCHALWQLLSRVWFGEIVLRLTTVPVRVGGPLQGNIQLQARKVPRKVSLKLKYRQFHVGSVTQAVATGKPSGIDEETSSYKANFEGTSNTQIRRRGETWSESLEVTPRSDGHVTFAFNLPVNLAPSGAIGLSGAEHSPPPVTGRWQLSISAKVAGLELRRTYWVPVFSAAIPAQQTASAKYAELDDASESPLGIAAKALQDPTVVEILSKLQRALKTLPILAFIGIFAYIGVKFFYPDMLTDNRQTDGEQKRGAFETQLRDGFAGFEIKPHFQASRVLLGGRGVSAAVSGADLVVKIEELRSELFRPSERAVYKGIGIDVYSADNRHLGQVRDTELRGTLTAQSPVTTHSGQVFVVPGVGGACTTQQCRVRLVMSLQEAGIGGQLTQLSPLALKPEDTLTVPPQAPPKFWDTYYDQAFKAQIAKRYTESSRLLTKAASVIEQNLGTDHPALAAVHLSQAHNHRKQKNSAGYERAMNAALNVLSGHSHADVRDSVRVRVLGYLDREWVARRLGDHYWDKRKYKTALRYYQQAYDATPSLDISDDARNYRLAWSSSGIMKTACMTRQLERAKAAMAELKQRYKNVTAGTQKRLHYWIRTGEPMLASGQCG